MSINLPPIKSLSFLIAGTVVANTLLAQTYNISFYTDREGGTHATDFTLDNSTTSAPAAYSGDRWNDFLGGAVTATTLTDSEGGSAGVTYAMDGGGNFSTTAFGLDLMVGYAFTNASQTSTFAGLTPGSTWDLYIAAHGDQPNQETQITLGLDVKTTSPTYDINGMTWVENENYVVFKNVVADGSGEINFGWAGVVNTGALNGMQLIAVPEPSMSATLLGVSVLIVALSRRRVK